MKPSKMLDDYLIPYVCALATPLPEMQESFDDEYKVLSDLVKGKGVVDLGAGIGRPAHLLHGLAESMWLIEWDKRTFEILEDRFRFVDNVFCFNQDATNTKFGEEQFEVALATYNFIGCLDKPEDLVPEMKRLVKDGGVVFLCSWRTDPESTLLLKRYYPSIGIKVKRIHSGGTFTDHGFIRRHSIEYLEDQLKKNGLYVVDKGTLGPMWNYVVGMK